MKKELLFTIEDKVKESMKPENLKIECRDEDGKWIIYSDE